MNGSLTKRFACQCFERWIAIFVVVTLMVGVTRSVPAQAAEGGSKVSIALLGGLVFPSSSSATFAYGLTAGYRLFPNLSLGAYLIKYGIGLQTADSSTSVNAGTSVSLLGVQGIFTFSNGFSAGVRLGKISVSPNIVATDSVNTISINSGSSSLSIAPVLIYDFPLTSYFSAGGDVSYTYGISSTSPSVLAFLARIQLAF